jgi:hypothetical protein
MLKDLGLEIFCKGARNPELQSRRCAHTKDCKRVDRLTPALCQEAQQLRFLGLDANPVAGLAAFVIEPGANGETLWIELRGDAVGLDCLLKLSQIFQCGPKITIGVRAVSMKQDRLPISLNRLAVELLRLQDVAKIDVSFGETGPQRERTAVGLCGFARPAELL